MGRSTAAHQSLALARAEAGRRWAELAGGRYWLWGDDVLPPQYYWNLVFLHARRADVGLSAEMTPYIEEAWMAGRRSVRDLVSRFGPRWSKAQVEAVAWKVAGDAVARGRLLVELGRAVLTLEAEMALLPADAPPVLPPPLPTALEVLTVGVSTVAEISTAAGVAGAAGPKATDAAHKDGEDGEDTRATIDADTLPPGKRGPFLRNLAAVEAVRAGRPLGAVACAYGYASHQHLAYLVRRAGEKGQRALVPYGTYGRPGLLPDALKAVATRLWKRPERLTVRAVADHHEMRATAGRLGVPWPGYDQVYRHIRTIAQRPDLVAARSGLAHPPRPRSSRRSYVLSIPAAALVCQVDEHAFDIVVTDADGVPLRDRVHGAVLICVKTGAILAAVLSLDPLTEGDYMRLVKQALEPKGRLTARHKCVNAWACAGKPAIIFHDRGPIFTSERARQVVVQRLRIATERAPAYCPQAKGTVEALFRWVSEKFTHRLPGTLKSSPADRGAYDSAAGAAAAGITLDLLETYFYQAIVDGYMREPDALRRGVRWELWDDAVRESGVARWVGDADDLLLLLMKARNRKNPATGRYAIHPTRGLSFDGESYVAPGLLNRLHGQEVDIYVDPRDVSVIYLFHRGVYVGEAYGARMMGRRTSMWEARRARHRARAAGAAGRRESRENLAGTLEAAHQGPAAHARAGAVLERRRQLDRQREEIHPARVLAMLEALEESNRARQPSDAAPAAQPVAPRGVAAPIPDDTLVAVRRPERRERGREGDPDGGGRG